jgi:hypothetical protein
MLRSGSYIGRRETKFPSNNLVCAPKASADLSAAVTERSLVELEREVPPIPTISGSKLALCGLVWKNALFMF